MIDFSDMVTDEFLKKFGITYMKQEPKQFGKLYLNSRGNNKND